MATELGHQVCAVVSTEGETIEAVSKLKPDVVILDYRLAEGGNGLKVAHSIREAQDVPIIFCTAYGESVRPELQGLPRVHLIGKPVTIDRLRHALTWAVNAHADEPYAA